MSDHISEKSIYERNILIFYSTLYTNRALSLLSYDSPTKIGLKHLHSTLCSMCRSYNGVIFHGCI